MLVLDILLDSAKQAERNGSFDVFVTVYGRRNGFEYAFGDSRVPAELPYFLFVRLA